MGSIVRFPGDLVTEHDRRRLTAAAEGSPFDLEFRKNGQGVMAPYLTRCGHLRPSFRLRKTPEGWEAISLGADETGMVAGQGRSAEALFHELGQRTQ
ncbi:MAG: hypothetical protein Q8J92_14085 [Parvibaculum sp.]|nr:hypothetical protein [Parvibaculum sp.]